MLVDILTGYMHVFQMENLIIVVLGTLIGVALGSFPGLDCTVGVALFLPVTYAMTPAQAILLLSAICGRLRSYQSIIAVRPEGFAEEWGVPPSRHPVV